MLLCRQEGKQAKQALALKVQVEAEEVPLPVQAQVLSSVLSPNMVLMEILGHFFSDGTCNSLDSTFPSVFVCVRKAIEEQVQAALTVQEPAPLQESAQKEVSLQGPRQTLTEQVQVRHLPPFLD